eukprot:5721039-Pleurochrysis_carterae.AAC.1
MRGAGRRRGGTSGDRQRAHGGRGDAEWGDAARGGGRADGGGTTVGEGDGGGGGGEGAQADRDTAGERVRSDT